MINTLFMAVVLVGVVVLVFLQDWRAMILPMIDVPVSLIGTFAVMAVMGYSLNNISLFGLVLAIGIVVDDAIVVLENIERQMAMGLDAADGHDHGDGGDHRPDPGHHAGAVRGVRAVRLHLRHHRAVFPPVRGDHLRLDDHLGRQRPDPDAVAGLCDLQDQEAQSQSRRSEVRGQDQESGGVAVVVFRASSAGCCTVWLWPHLPCWFCECLRVASVAWHICHSAAGGELDGEDARRGGTGRSAALHFLPGLLVGLVVGWFVIRPVNAILGWFFRGFDRAFDWMTTVYDRIVRLMLRCSPVVLLLYGGLLALTVWVFLNSRTGFVPDQDQGRLIVSLQLPDATALEHTKRVMDRMETIAHDNPSVAHTITNSGSSAVAGANAPNYGSMFVILKPFGTRPDAAAGQDASFRGPWTGGFRKARSP